MPEMSSLGVFFRKKIIFFWKKGNFAFVGKRNTVFIEYTEDIIFAHIFWKRPSFVFRLKKKVIFSGKRNTIFPDNARKTIFQCNFFQNIWKKKIGFFVQWWDKLIKLWFDTQSFMLVSTKQSSAEYDLQTENQNIMVS